VGFIEEVGAAAFLDWIEGAALLFVNSDEARALSGSEVLEQQMRVLGRRVGRVVIKRGSAGAALGDAAGVALTLPAPVVEVVDTTGAGDAFAAAFLIADLGGEQPAACLAAGIAAGAAAVKRVGGQPG
jgi:sugar/nucleoside kinase (ribokinase family)